MRRAVGSVYIASGLVCEFAPLLFAGQSLGRGTSVYTSGVFLRAFLWHFASMLLILSGVVAVIENVRRSILCFITGALVVAGLGAWAVPIAGWRRASLSVLAPAGVFFLLASLIVLLVKKRWFLALLGSIASAPSALLAAFTLLFMWGYAGGAGPWTLREVSPVFPLVGVIVSFICALRVRIA
jgi:hypothetical protein